MASLEELIEQTVSSNAGDMMDSFQTSAFEY